MIDGTVSSIGFDCYLIRKQFLMFTGYVDKNIPAFVNAACLGYVRCMGRPLYHASFVPPHDAHDPSKEMILDLKKWFTELTIHWEDPLREMGGLGRESEGGRWMYELLIQSEQAILHVDNMQEDSHSDSEVEAW